MHAHNIPETPFASHLHMLESSNNVNRTNVTNGTYFIVQGNGTYIVQGTCWIRRYKWNRYMLDTMLQMEQSF
jgi:hypothetical protein